MNKIYDPSSIEVLSGISHARKRTSMYLGSTDSIGYHHAFNEIFDNSIDEFMNGYGFRIDISIYEDGKTVSIEDWGRGIPVGIHSKSKKSALELVLTELNAGGKFDDKTYSSAGGLHGVGASVVNAVSSYMKAEICREGALWQQEYSQGIPKTEVKKIRDLKSSEKKNGTKITFCLDSEIFKTIKEFDEDILLSRIHQKSFLNKGLEINYKNLKTKTVKSFKSENGIVDYVTFLNENRNNAYPINPIYSLKKIPFHAKESDITIEIGLQWTQDVQDDELILSFANNIYNKDGGTHESGFKRALTKTVNDYGRKIGLIKEKDTSFQGRDIQEGLAAVISVNFSQAEFVGQTKDRLTTQEVESLVSGVTSSILTEYFEKNSAVFKKIIDRAELAQEARDAAKKQINIIKRGGLFGKIGKMPSKLIDCNSEKSEESELYLVEGDSAAGGMSKGRNPEYQAYMPLRGKIINTEKKDLKQALANKEVVSIIKAIGTGISDEFDIGKLRYNKIILATDSDQDGAHIATLLITFFYNFMKPLIENGNLYIAKGPLYKLVDGNKKQYCFTEEEMQTLVKGNSKLKITRFKGLGEMNPDELGETMMDPSSRHLIQISLKEPIESHRMLTNLMGSDPKLRKEHITKHINNR